MNIICENEEIEIGDTVVFRSELSGFEGVSIRFQWQWYVQDEETGDWDWENAPGGTGDTYTFVMTEELVNREWRLLVSTND